MYAASSSFEAISMQYKGFAQHNYLGMVKEHVVLNVELTNEGIFLQRFSEGSADLRMDATSTVYITPCSSCGSSSSHSRCGPVHLQVEAIGQPVDSAMRKVQRYDFTALERWLSTQFKGKYNLARWNCQHFCEQLIRDLDYVWSAFLGAVLLPCDGKLRSLYRVISPRNSTFQSWSIDYNVTVHLC